MLHVLETICLYLSGELILSQELVNRVYEGRLKTNLGLLQGQSQLLNVIDEHLLVKFLLVVFQTDVH